MCLVYGVYVFVYVSVYVVQGRCVVAGASRNHFD